AARSAPGVRARRRGPAMKAPVLLLLLATACQPGELWNDRLERMVDQPRADSWEATAAFPDGRVVQPPPEGTVPFDASPLPASEGFPIALDRAVFERGRDRF